MIKQPFGYFDDFPPPYDYDLLINKYGYRIISMVRDPRDVLVSKHMGDLSKYWVEPKFIYINCEEYLKRQNNPDVLFVRYEQLVIDPAREMQRISDFIGCGYSKDFVNFYKLPEAGLDKNRSLNGPRKISTTSIGNWKKQEHEERIKEIMTDELKYHIKKLGY